MSKLAFTPLAEADLLSILNYIAQDRPDTAVRIVSEIREKCEFLARNPLLASAVRIFRRSTVARPFNDG